MGPYFFHEKRRRNYLDIGVLKYSVLSHYYCHILASLPPAHNQMQWDKSGVIVCPLHGPDVRHKRMETSRDRGGGVGGDWGDSNSWSKDYQARNLGFCVRYRLPARSKCTVEIRCHEKKRVFHQNVLKEWRFKLAKSKTALLYPRDGGTNVGAQFLEIISDKNGELLGMKTWCGGCPLELDLSKTLELLL